MCVAEPGRVLQTIPKQTINADVSGPNQSIGHQPELLGRRRESDEKQGCHKRMDSVVKSRPKPCACQISQHGKIWYQDQEGKANPTGSCFAVQKKACAKYDTALSAENQTRARKHTSSIAQGGPTRKEEKNSHKGNLFISGRDGLRAVPFFSFLLGHEDGDDSQISGFFLKGNF